MVFVVSWFWWLSLTLGKLFAARGNVQLSNAHLAFAGVSKRAVRAFNLARLLINMRAKTRISFFPFRVALHEAFRDFAALFLRRRTSVGVRAASSLRLSAPVCDG